MLCFFCRFFCENDFIIFHKNRKARLYNLTIYKNEKIRYSVTGMKSITY